MRNSQTLHSHTPCQVAQKPFARAKTCQRVWLHQRCPKSKRGHTILYKSNIGFGAKLKRNES